MWTTHTFLFTPVFFSLRYSPWHPCRLSVSSVVAVLGSECSSLRCLLPLPWLSPLSLVSVFKCHLLYLEILAWLFQKQALNALLRVLLPPPPSPGVPNFISFCLPSKLIIEAQEKFPSARQPVSAVFFPFLSLSSAQATTPVVSVLGPYGHTLLLTPWHSVPSASCDAFNKALLGLCSLLRKWPWLECVLHRLMLEHIH